LNDFGSPCLCITAPLEEPNPLICGHLRNLREIHLVTLHLCASATPASRVSRICGICGRFTLRLCASAPLREPFPSSAAICGISGRFTLRLCASAPLRDPNPLIYAHLRHLRALPLWTFRLCSSARPQPPDLRPS